MDSNLKKYQTGFTGPSGYKGLRPKGISPQGEINPINPVNPVRNKKLKIESIQQSVPLLEKILRLICYRNYE